MSTPPTFDPNTSPDCLEIYRFILAHMDAIGKNLISNNQEVRFSIHIIYSYLL